MSFWASVLYVVLGLGLVAYALTGGADLGAGVFHLVASGPRKDAQRAAIRRAIAPIWEANHVWLIFVIVVMFSAFSRAFSALSVAFHIPIGLALLGLVFRGAAFVFQAYGIQSGASRRTWERVFAASSILTPVFLGTVLAGVASGDVRVVDHAVTTGFFAGWTTPFAWLTGLFALALFAMLAATYLAADEDDPLARDFRARALVSEAVSGTLALLVLLRARVDAPLLYANLVDGAFTWPLQGGTALAALATVVLLVRRSFRIARITVAVQVALVVIGFGVAMDGHFILPDVSVARAVRHEGSLPALAATLGAGAAVLVPALIYLFRVFKSAKRHDR